MEVLSQNTNRARIFSQTGRFEIPRLIASGWKDYPKNTLLGFCDIECVDVGVIIRKVCVHSKGGQRWVSLPAKPWTDKEGNQQWTPVVEFANSDVRAAFQSAAIKAIDDLRKS